VFAFCAARKAGEPEQYPRLAAKPTVAVSVTRVWCAHRGRLLLHRAEAGARRLATQHELPTAEQAGLTVAVAAKGELLAQRKRGITKYRITESIYRADPKAISEKMEPGLVWIPLTELEKITLSGPHRRWVGEILEDHAEARRPRSF
jgi:A/G-specific adenine glycosylase